MASSTETTGKASANITTAQRDAANANFTVGAVIAASDIDYLRGLINTVCGHTHSIVDYSAKYTYGNSGSNTKTDENTDAAGTDATYNPGPGSTITAAGFNNLRASVATVRSHAHNWNDKTS